MADTHINAFFAEVQDAEEKLVIAQGQLEDAKRRLEAKKIEVGFVEEPDTSE